MSGAWKSPSRRDSLHIPQQQCDTDEMRGLAEDLVFNPWHCRPEHSPIGGFNRARRQVYRALADFRRERNGVLRR
jgi:hypothetical protein